MRGVVSTTLDLKLVDFDSEEDSKVWADLFNETVKPKVNEAARSGDYVLLYEIDFSAESLLGTAEGEPKALKFRVWDPLMKHYPGWNSPVVEVFEGGTRIVVQELSKVGWADDLWGSIQWVKGEDDHIVLSTMVNHRHKLARSVYVYHFDREKKLFEFQHEYFPKEELAKGRESLDEMREQFKPKKKE